MDRILRKIKRFIVVAALSLIVPTTGICQEKEDSELRAVHHDIVVINLLNSLDLDREQMRYILAKTEQVKDVQEDSAYKISSCTTEMADTAAEIKAEVGSGKVSVKKETAKRFRQAKEEILQTKRDTNAKIDEIVSTVEQELEQFQLIALDNYKPCIIPQGSNGRIGQADSSKGITNMLDRIRSIPDTAYSRKREQIVERFVENAEKRLPPKVGFDEARVRGKVISTFDKVRDMGIIDYQIEKEALAKELKDMIVPEKKAIPRKDKIKKFLIAENVIPILRERLEA